MNASKGKKPIAATPEQGKSAQGAELATAAPREPSSGLLFQKKYDLPASDISARYLVFSSQRTGSNYICRRLCNVDGRFGLPSEYLHPNSYRALAGRLLLSADRAAGKEQKVPLGRYLKAVESVRTTADGQFGIKVQPQQLTALTGTDRMAFGRFFTRFDRVILMSRRDKLAQAVSGALAQKTGVWFNDGKDPTISDADYAVLIGLVASNLNRYILEDRMMQSIAKTIKKPVLQIQYEELAADGDAIFLKVLEFLAPDRPSLVNEAGDMPLPERPEGAVAKELRERFLHYIGGGEA